MANYTHLCWQGTVQCSPRGHRTREAADRCAARHNSVLRSLGLLTEPNRWIVRANPRRVEDIDYKDLFRDAVLMMAAMARAAGFDSKDENVEPPDIIARVENQRAEVERLTAERAALTQALDDNCAPDIDGQQVKTLTDRVNALLGHWQDKIRGALCAVVPDPHRIDGGGCDSGDPLDLTLAEVAQAVNQLTDRADERIAALTAERDAARRDAEERRLELLAERGEAEGAPSQDWRWTGEIWFHPPTCMVVEPAGRLWRLNPDASDPRRWRRERFDDMPARAAMLAADKATP